MAPTTTHATPPDVQSAGASSAMPVGTVDTATGKQAPASVSEQRVLDIFTGIADGYERFNHLSSFGQDRRWLDKLVELAPITSASRVLDVAGGTGEVSFAICRRRHPAHIMLTDFTPAMLDVARARIDAGDARGVNIDLAVVDAQDMPFEDDSFDVVTMAYGIRNMPDRMAALRQVNRVLVPGGTACILEFSRPPLAVPRAFYNAYLKWGIPAWGQYCTGRRDDFVYLAQSIRAFPDQRAFAAMLEQAGFVDVRYVNLSFGAVAIHTAVKSARP